MSAGPVADHGELKLGRIVIPAQMSNGIAVFSWKEDGADATLSVRQDDGDPHADQCRASKPEPLHGTPRSYPMTEDIVMRQRRHNKGGRRKSRSATAVPGCPG